MKKNQFLLIALYLIAALLIPSVAGAGPYAGPSGPLAATNALFVPLAAAENAADQPETNPDETPVSTEEPNLLPEDPNILAHAALLVDLNDHGKILYGKNEHERAYPASLTKIMTALLVFDAVADGQLSMDQEITASGIVQTVPAGSSTANPALKEGEIMTVRNLLYCLLVKSANEAADVLAEAVSGSVSAFVEAMNAKAEELGCENTHFVNPHGFHNHDHYTTAWDVSLMTRAAMKYPDFMTICDTVNITIPATNLSGQRTGWNTNALRSRWTYGDKYINPEAHGVKTGSTNEAGYCLVSTAERGRMHVLSVVMGADRVTEDNGSVTVRSFSETTRLFNWGFDNFHYATILEQEIPIQEVPVDLSKTDHIVAISSNAVEALIPAKLSGDNMEKMIQLDDEILTAPVEAGQHLGTLELRYKGVTYGKADLLALYGAEASQWMVALRRAEEFVKRPVVMGAGGAVLLAAVALGIRSVITGRNRYRYGHASSASRAGYTGKKRR